MRPFPKIQLIRDRSLKIKPLWKIPLDLKKPMMMKTREKILDLKSISSV